MHMRHLFALALGTLPLLVFGAVAFSRPALPVMSKPAPPAVRVIPLDTRTFDQRWPANALPQENRVQSIRVAGEIPLPTARPAVDENAAPVSSPPTRVVRRAALRQDLCARHGLRKVSYGRRWRCRR